MPPRKQGTKALEHNNARAAKFQLRLAEEAAEKARLEIEAGLAQQAEASSSRDDPQDPRPSPPPDFPEPIQEVIESMSEDIERPSKRARTTEELRYPNHPELSVFFEGLMERIGGDYDIEEDQSMVQVTLTHDKRFLYDIDDEPAQSKRFKVIVLSRETGDNIPMFRMIQENGVYSLRFIAAVPGQVVDTIVLVHLKLQGTLKHIFQITRLT